MSQQCLACSDFLSNCLNCTSATFCTACDVNFYFQDTSATNQTCEPCNYTCLTCTSTWYKCSSCDAGAFRVLDPATKRCVCQGTSYFELGVQITCAQCPNYIMQCSVCYNQSFCITCGNGYYVQALTPGVNTCSSCQAPCS